MENNEPQFKQEIQQMMYIAGETQEPPLETITLVEEIIRDQVIHMLTTANELASRRGSRVFSNDDLIFQIRHDTARVSRLRTFLGWKSIRKTVKDSDDKIDGADLAAVDNDALNAATATESIEEPLAKKERGPTISLPWDIASFYGGGILPGDTEDDEPNEMALDKLRKADERTQNMTVEEYATWSEYRHASFTWRKAKRFRQWSGLGVIAENKPADDILDILGFLTSEMVQTLTVEALAVQSQESIWKQQIQAGEGSSKLSSIQGIFTTSEISRTPCQPRHIRQAFENLQKRPRKGRAMPNWVRAPQTSGLKLL
ncbi:transcription initiation factor IID, 18kD subunit-domain-containing protein [Xylogone sp. PMI_703]|nr:transcription initiation factor IID, 18kD subunit-domain-containing protein [Xylogone sp. PMI_703]